MITMLKNWPGEVVIDGKSWQNGDKAVSEFKPESEQIHIVLRPVKKEAVVADGNRAEKSGMEQEYRITVKQYMTRKSTPEFDFMAKWNNDMPMPYRTMTGKKIKETRGMVYMELHGDIWADKIFTCMCCGKKLTNPVSQFFGIGPECGGHNYVHPFDSDAELKAAVNSYKKQLQSVTWTGWVIKSAIQEEVEV